MTWDAETIHFVLDGVVLLVSVFSGWMHLQTKLEISNLKLWIHENFEPKRTRRD